MDKTLRTIVIALSLFSGVIILPAIAPVRADNAVSTTSADFVTAGDDDCTNGEIMDDEAAAETRQRVEAVGYTDVQILDKNCDNFWRVTGIKGGATRDLIVTPDGGVMPGGN